MLRLAIVVGVLATVVACAKKENAEPLPAGGVAMSVTENGFEPSEIKIKKGEAIQLVITRKTDKTCARDFVLDEAGIHQALPLGEPVTVSLNMKEAGRVVFGCAMGKMVKGVLVVE